MNIEMKIEQHERYYRVIFTPDTNYGNISAKVYSRKEAYTKYHEIKNIVYNTRPGKLAAFEYILDETGHYKENYLCACRTGKSVDTIAIFNNIDKELQQILLRIVSFREKRHWVTDLLIYQSFYDNVEKINDELYMILVTSFYHEVNNDKDLQFLSKFLTRYCHLKNIE